MHVAEVLAQALAKYQEDEPWETLNQTAKDRCRRLGALLAGELTKLASQSPSPPSSTLAIIPEGLSLSLDQAVEVSVAVPLTVGGVTGALSPSSVQCIFEECLKQIRKGEQA